MRVGNSVKNGVFGAYPFGMALVGRSWNGENYRYGFTGHEKEDEIIGSSGTFYSTEYRLLDVRLGRWLSVDKLADEYTSLSVYAYVANNPLFYIDPDGKVLKISGALANEGLSQLQQKVGPNLRLVLDPNTGVISYIVVNPKGKLSKDAQRLMRIINDKDITVHLKTTNMDKTTTGKRLVGGAFMGNTVNTDADGNRTVVAVQEINPNVLGSADNYTNTPGKMIFHETTEAYEGAIISRSSRDAVGAKPAEVGSNNPVYDKAHSNASPETDIYEINYDASGREIKPGSGFAYRTNYYVKKKENIIQSSSYLKSEHQPLRQKATK